MTVEVTVEETKKLELAASKQHVPKMSAQVDEKTVETAPNSEHGSEPELVEKSSSYREESNYLSDLKEGEWKALSAFKSKLQEAILGNTLLKSDDEKDKEKEKQPNDKKGDPTKEEESDPIQEPKFVGIEDVSIWGVPLLPSKSSEGTDVVLLKFLRAREFKVNEAFEMLKKTLIWRAHSKIEMVLEEDLGAHLANAAYMKGTDRSNHPVCYNIFGVFRDEELYQKTFGTEEKREQFMRWRFQLMEEGIKKLDFRPGGVTSILQIYDLKNCPGPSKKEIRSATFKAIGLLQDNYPEMVAKNVFINVPYWYYAFYSIISPFLTQRSKSKFVVAHPAKVTETLLKYISIEEIPIQYGGFKRENDLEFATQESEASEMVVKPGSTETIEIPAPKVGATLIWDLAVLGWEVSYKEEFIPTDEGSYAIIVHKEKKMDAREESVRNSFKNNEPGKVVVTIINHTKKRKQAFYRYKSLYVCI